MIAVGSKVRLTKKFLKNIGQNSSDARTVWIVIGCNCSSCKSGSHISTNELLLNEYCKQIWTPEELRDNPFLRNRHVAISNIEVIKSR